MPARGAGPREWGGKTCDLASSTGLRNLQREKAVPPDCCQDRGLRRLACRKQHLVGMTSGASAESLNQLTSLIIQAAIRVHKALGPGLLETAYLNCLCFELSSSGIAIETQKTIPLVYRGVKIDCAYRADLIVAGQVLVEVKALESTAPIHAQQLYTYIRLADLRVGLLLNFGARTMKDGVKRVVNDFPE
jgi:GxxExxY protein